MAEPRARRPGRPCGQAVSGDRADRRGGRGTPVQSVRLPSVRAGRAADAPGQGREWFGRGRAVSCGAVSELLRSQGGKTGLWSRDGGKRRRRRPSGRLVRRWRRRPRGLGQLRAALAVVAAARAPARARGRGPVAQPGAGVVFSYLELSELRSCALVCKHWYRCLHGDENSEVWRSLRPAWQRRLCWTSSATCPATRPR